MEEISHKSRSTKEDLTGQQFGRLTAKRIVTSLRKGGENRGQQRAEYHSS